MAILQLLQQLLTTKATAMLAAFALIGGGAAIAVEGNEVEPADDDPVVVASETENAWALGRADDDQMERIGAFCEENPEASFCSGDSHPVFSTPPEDAGSEVADDTGSTEPTVEADEGLGEDVEESAEVADTRSATAKRVHRALTGDDTRPGDPEFGRKISERARNGGHGDRVSRAARGEDDPDDGDTTSPDEADDQADASRSSAENEDEGEPEVIGPPADAGPPAGTPASSRGKGRGGR